ncbi:hypothetical protein C0583_01570 [Candidatus Parcubacteria bacterium]|nr:MAG: hypothetical protein C0583_01570 [Candidatus Parcubacteria bacterium]
MLSNNIALYGAKILVEISRDFLYFPVWWYSQGLYYFSKKLILFLSNMQKSLALWVWIKNIHRPMYQQKDWQGRLISFFIRIVQIIVRALAMLVWLLVCLLLFLAWVAVPIYAFYQLYYQIVF